MAVELPKANVESLSTSTASTELIRLMEDFPVTNSADKPIKDAAVANLSESTQGLVDVFATTMKANGMDGVGETDVIDTMNVLIRENGLPDRGTPDSMLSICTLDHGGHHVISTVICAPVNVDGQVLYPTEEYRVGLLTHLGIIEPGETMEDFLVKTNHEDGEVASVKYQNLAVNTNRDGTVIDVVQRIIPLCEEELLQSIAIKVEGMEK